LHGEVEKVIMETRDKKVAGDDDIAVDVLKLLGEGGLRSMAQLISNTHTELDSDPSYNECLKDEAKSYKMQRSSHRQQI